MLAPAARNHSTPLPQRLSISEFMPLRRYSLGTPIFRSQSVTSVGQGYIDDARARRAQPLHPLAPEALDLRIHALETIFLGHADLPISKRDECWAGIYRRCSRPPRATTPPPCPRGSRSQNSCP